MKNLITHDEKKFICKINDDSNTAKLNKARSV